MDRSSSRRLLSGWGSTAATLATVLRPGQGDALNPLVETAGRASGKGGCPPGLIARGLGRSYGDAAQCAGGTVVEMTDRTEVVTEDLGEGVVTVEAGASVDALMRRYVPQGWFVPVTPGTRQVTLGGAIAADIHGKNHHVDGTFSAHVESLVLVTPQGTHLCSPEGENAELFWATAGGMGLTGIIERATVRLIPIETSLMAVDIQRCRDLDDLMATMADGDAAFRYSVAWIDCLSGGASLGRAVLTRGDHAQLDEVPEHRRSRRFDPVTRLAAPPGLPSGLLNRVTVKAFNEAWFRRAPKTPSRRLESIASFFHPLDGVRNWNRLYGNRGFLQYQVVLPFGAEPELRLLIETFAKHGAASFLAVLKRFGAQGPGHLSFPMAGWTLALDLPAGPGTLGPMLDGLDEVVVAAGGRVYLAKDSRLRPELLPSMYPRLEEWRAVRDRIDPDRVLQSDLSRRLDLTGGFR